MITPECFMGIRFDDFKVNCISLSKKLHIHYLTIMTNLNEITIPFFDLLDGDAIHMAQGKFRSQYFSKGDLLVREGKVCNGLYFIQKGLVYAYTLEGRILWYEMDGSSFTDLRSFFERQPSEQRMRIAEDDTALAYIMRDDLLSLYRASHRWALWGVRFYESELLRITNHYESLRTKDASKRYHDLVAAYPQILQRVPLGHIASYLGLSQVSLSRIRAGIQRK